VIGGIWCGFWFRGNPTPDELRLALRQITREEQPSFDPVVLWAAGGAAALGAGIDAPVVWIREDSRGNELERGVWEGEGMPAVGAEVSRSTVDGRWWNVVAVEQQGDRSAVHLRKTGDPAPDPYLVQHHVAAPPSTNVL